MLLVIGISTEALQDTAPNSFHSFTDDLSLSVLAPPDNQITLLGARKGSVANDFGVCSVEDVVAAVEVGKMGISSDHLPVLFHILSNAKDDAEESRTIWNCRGDRKRSCMMKCKRKNKNLLSFNEKATTHKKANTINSSPT